MTAIHAWTESNTVDEIETNPITNLNFGSNDSPNLNTTTYPIIRGKSSYEKYIRCKFTGTFSEISNMKFFKSAGALGTGETIKAAANVAFATPSQTANGDSDVPVTQETALSVESAEGDSVITYGASGVSGYTKYIRLQLRGTIEAALGAVAQKTFTFLFDEI
jgi:hypothetical protein